MAVVDTIHDVAGKELGPLRGSGWVSVVIPFVREKGFVKCATALEADSSYVRYEIIAEYDKDRIGCPKMVRRLVERAKYDYVCFLADDTLPQHGMLLEAMKVMATFPDGWGLVGLNSHDFHCNDRRASHWMASKMLLPYLGGEFFHTGYNHSFCDDELVDRCNVIGRYKYAKNAKLQHLHPLIHMGLSSDKDYERVSKLNGVDACLYIARKSNSNQWKNRI